MVEEHCQNRRILAIHAKEAGGGPRDGQFDEIVIGESVTEAALTESLVGRELCSTHRKGKQMWLHLSGSTDPLDLLFHFGMTGALSVKGVDAPQYKSFSVSEKEVWPPRFCKLLIEFSGDVSLAFSDPRRLGRVLLRVVAVDSPPVSELAADPVHDMPSLEDFRSVLGSRNVPVK